MKGGVVPGAWSLEDKPITGISQAGAKIQEDGDTREAFLEGGHCRHPLIH